MIIKSLGYISYTAVYWVILYKRGGNNMIMGLMMLMIILNDIREHCWNGIYVNENICNFSQRKCIICQKYINMLITLTCFGNMDENLNMILIKC